MTGVPDAVPVDETAPVDEAASDALSPNRTPSTTVRNSSRMTFSSTARNEPNPLAVGTLPLSTPGSAGSSSCKITCAPGTRFRTSARCNRRPSARDSAMSRTAPLSASSLSPYGSSTTRGKRPRADCLDFQRADVALGVLLQQIQIGGEVTTCPAMVSARPIRDAPTRGLHLCVQVHANSAVLRPTMSAPTPRCGSSGRKGRPGRSPSSPMTMRIASTHVLARQRTDACGRGCRNRGAGALRLRLCLFVRICGHATERRRNRRFLRLSERRANPLRKAAGSATLWHSTG